ncbi:MAG TPA: RNA methyltransferase [Solirubrobacteraceae bacterium]|jgi:TrmH family RNA methyltransferase|nr:RNA methyltransferase [Solirubrobacteraceae bacterium]
MTPITSPNNPKLKALRNLTRARERARTGLFVAEGEDLVRAAHAAGREPVYGFRAPGVELDAPSFEELAPELLAGVSTLGSGTRAIGVYEQRFGQAQGPLCVYLHGVGDPGNVGTILRGALAFGASSVVLGPGCADPHSPKAVRASMGAIFAVPIARVERAEQLPGERVALVAHAGEPLTQLRPVGDVTLLVGAEREGLPDEVIAVCEHVAHIPIAGESLNAAMAATVALYETTRRRLTEEGLAGAGETLASGSHPRSGQPASGRLRHPLGRVSTS